MAFQITKHFMSAALVGAGFFIASTSIASADWTFRTKCYAGGCVETFQWGVPGTSLANIVRVPGPQTDEERAEAAERDRKWVAHCKPTLREDRYGMTRYVYEKPGCEFGRSGN